MTLATDSIIAAKTNRATLTIQIEALLSRLHPAVERERRHDDRVAIPVLFRLTPFDADRQPLEQEASIVVGKNISRRGVSFYHEHPITHRRALIELADPSVGSFVAEIDVSLVPLHQAWLVRKRRPIDPLRGTKNGIVNYRDAAIHGGNTRLFVSVAPSAMPATST